MPLLWDSCNVVEKYGSNSNIQKPEFNWRTTMCYMKSYQAYPNNLILLLQSICKNEYINASMQLVNESI